MRWTQKEELTRETEKASSEDSHCQRKSRLMTFLRADQMQLGRGAGERPINAEIGSNGLPGRTEEGHGGA